LTRKIQVGSQVFRNFANNFLVGPIPPDYAMGNPTSGLPPERGGGLAFLYVSEILFQKFLKKFFLAKMY
jgi:hypothetical protein